MISGLQSATIAYNKPIRILPININMSLYRTYSNYQDVRLCPIEQRPLLADEYFLRPDEGEIKKIVKNAKTSMERLLRLIHKNYKDQGLRISLIHKLFESKSSDIAYYVPELVYIAIKKPCKHMKKVLINHAKNNESLRRLILWNVQAFTVLMKEKSQEMKEAVAEFEESLIEHVQSRSRFTHSLKAITMLTEASLILKKMPVESQKDKLQKFVRRFNAEYLNNLKHDIIIPFRYAESEKYWSNYVVRIVEGDCSCFPTRKRVPYRIIIETIDQKELEVLKPDEKFEKVTPVEPDPQRDLFNEVTEAMQKKFSNAYLNIQPNAKSLFVVDVEEQSKMEKLKDYLNDIEKQETKESVMTKSKAKVGRRSSLLFNPTYHMYRKQNDLNKFKITPSPNLEKFQTIYIPDLRSESRRSDIVSSYEKLVQSGKLLTQPKKRKSDKYVEEQHHKNVKTYQQDIRDVGFVSQSVFGKPWQQKVTLYKRNSLFRKFSSLRLRNVVVKGGDDLRQEIICMQLIFKMKQIFEQAKLKVFIKPYEIIVLSENSGLLEFVQNSISIDQMKKKSEEGKRDISKFFTDVFQTEDKLKAAKQNFVASLAGSSIMTYVLKLKDRHNGNILLDMDGHIIHIDFGFILGMSPGGLNFQKSPFKFTKQYLDFIGGKKGNKLYDNFRTLFAQGMLALREKLDQLLLILEIMMEESDLDCFKKFNLEVFKEPFRLDLDDKQFEEFCYELIEESCENYWTVSYDEFQSYSNHIMK